MIHLGKSWQVILQKAWSVRLSVAASLFFMLELMMPAVALSVPRFLFVALGLIATIGSVWARVLVQKQIQQLLEEENNECTVVGPLGKLVAFLKLLGVSYA